MPDDKINEVLVLKPARPHVVSLISDHLQGDRAVLLPITLGDDPGVGLQWDNAVLVAMNMEDGHLCLGQGGEARDGIVLPEDGLEFGCAQSVSTAGPREPGPAAA